MHQLLSFNAARGRWSVATAVVDVSVLLENMVSMPHAAGGRLQQHHVGSPMILDLTGTIWREMQNYSIFSILEHVHKSEIEQKIPCKARKKQCFTMSTPVLD